MKKFISGRIRSLRFALKGMILLLRTEHAIISQAILSLIFIAMGFYFQITRIEWILQLFFIGFVLTVESLNTAVEKVCDFIHPDFSNRIGFIKDISAGAVSFAALFSLINAAIIYYPYIFKG